MSSASPTTSSIVRAALRVGLASLEAGRSSETAQGSANQVAQAWGLDDIEVIVAGRVVTVQHAPDDAKGHSRMGTVASLDAFNCDHMTQLEQHVGEVTQAPGSIAPAVMESRVRETMRSARPAWWTLSGGLLLAICVTMQVNFSWPSALVAAVIYAATWGTRWLTSRIALPKLFAVALQTLVGAGVGALTVLLTGLPAQVAVVAVAVNWMLLIPLPQLISTIVDAVGSFTQSALVRAAAFVMTCAGVVIGGALAITLLRDPAATESIPVTLPVLPVIGVLVFSMLGAVGNAFANAGGADLILPAAVIGVCTAGVQLTLTRAWGAEAVWASGITATILGFACALWASRSRYSSTALALVGLTGALLPGLTVYQGIASLIHGSDAATFFGQAALVGTALGIGTAFGFTLASLVLRAAVRPSATAAAPTA